MAKQKERNVSITDAETGKFLVVIGEAGLSQWLEANTAVLLYTARRVHGDNRGMKQAFVKVAA